jgi:hypothetical protein
MVCLSGTLGSKGEKQSELIRPQNYCSIILLYSLSAEVTHSCARAGWTRLHRDHVVGIIDFIIP